MRYTTKVHATGNRVLTRGPMQVHEMEADQLEEEEERVDKNFSCYAIVCIMSGGIPMPMWCSREKQTKIFHV
jgi:hypothetical protein